MGQRQRCGLIPYETSGTESGLESGNLVQNPASGPDFWARSVAKSGLDSNILDGNRAGAR
jgi:hypothetical protein